MSICTDDGLVHGVSAMPDRHDELGLTWCAGRFDHSYAHTHRPVTCLGCLAGELAYQSILLDGHPVVAWDAQDLLRARRAREQRLVKMAGSLYPAVLRREIQIINTELVRRRSRQYHQS